MPPCHGGDRRFESGRARQVKTLSLSRGFYLDESAGCIGDLLRKPAGSAEAQVRRRRRSCYPVEPAIELMANLWQSITAVHSDGRFASLASTNRREAQCKP